MGKIVETKIDRFDGGIVNDPRDRNENTARVVSNFDVITSPRKMTPYRSSESGDDAGSTSQKQNFAIALRTGTTYSLYALGVISGATRAEILYKNLTTGAATDMDDNAWTNTANNQSGSGATNFNLFVYYARVGRIFGAKAGTTIWVYDPAGSVAFLEDGSGNSRSLTYTSIAQGLVHPKDDRLYIPYDNKIAKNNNGAWTDAAVTLPTNLVISSICEYGNYLAIAAAPISGIGNSVAFLWDRNAELVDISESIDWGTGTLKILESIDGELVGISQLGGTSTSGIPTVATTSFRDKVIFRKLVGNQAVKFLEIQANHSGSANTLKLPIQKQKIDNRLYFQMLIELNGSVRDGVWSIGRSSLGQPLTLIHERTTNNNTALASGDLLTGFHAVGSFLFQSYQPNGGDFALTKTDDGSTFSHNSVYETKTFNAGDPTMYKDLEEVAVFTEYMPTAGQITLAYQVDENIGTSTWTTIFTNTTDNSISHVANNIESSGAALPKNYKEIAFRILSTGGAEVTGLMFREEIVGRKYITD